MLVLGNLESVMLNYKFISADIWNIDWCDNPEMKHDHEMDTNKLDQLHLLNVVSL